MRKIPYSIRIIGDISSHVTERQAMVWSLPLAHTYAVVGHISLVKAIAEYRQSIIWLICGCLKAMQKQLIILERFSLPLSVFLHSCPLAHPDASGSHICSSLSHVISYNSSLFVFLSAFVTPFSFPLSVSHLARIVTQYDTYRISN